MKIPEISHEDFEQALMEHLNVTNFQAKLLIRHYGSIPDTIENVDEECADLQCVLQRDYREFPRRDNRRRQESTEKTLCKRNSINRQEPGWCRPHGGILVRWPVLLEKRRFSIELRIANRLTNKRHPSQGRMQVRSFRTDAVADPNGPEL